MYQVIYSLSVRESGNTHATNCVYLSMIESTSYHQEFLTHPMLELSCVSFPMNVWPARLLPEHTDVLSRLVKIKVVSDPEGGAPSL